MTPKFYKHRLLLDENISPRNHFTKLNSRYDVKHIAEDLHQSGIPDRDVYAFAREQNRLIVTFNAKDFQELAAKSTSTGVIGVSSALTDEQIDTKIAALLVRSTPRSLYGTFTYISGETEL